jgi:hypothetical protein
MQATAAQDAETAPLRSQLPEPSVPSKTRAAQTDGENNEEELVAPTALPRESRTSLLGDKSESRDQTIGSHAIDSAQGRLRVQISSSPDVSPPRSLSQSPVFSFKESGESLLPHRRLPWRSSSSSAGASISDVDLFSLGIPYDDLGAYVEAPEELSNESTYWTVRRA